MIEPLKTQIRRMPLLLGIVALLGGCPAPSTSEHWFDLNFNLVEVSPDVLETVEISLTQKLEGGATTGIFQKLKDSAQPPGTINNVAYTVAVGANSDQLVFTFAGNPFKAVGSTFKFTILHAPWGGNRTAEGKPLTPSFDVKLVGKGKGTTLASSSKTIEAGLLFSGPQANGSMWSSDPINVTCSVNKEACQSLDGSVNPPDAGPSDAGLVDEYTVSTLKIEPNVVTQGQPGIVLSFVLANLDFKEIKTVDTLFLIDGVGARVRSRSASSSRTTTTP
jgi:hypothetical protein